MEATQQQRRSSEVTGGDHGAGLNGASFQPCGTPTSSGSSASRVCSRCAKPRCNGNIGQRNGSNSSSIVKSVICPSWAEQIQDAHDAQRSDILQALDYPLGQNGAAADTQTSESERVDAMMVQHFESLAVDDTTLAITGLQPDLTNSEDGSNIQAAFSEGNRRPWSTYVSAGLLVYFVCVLVLWQERCENMSPTLQCDPEIELEASAATGFAAWAQVFQDTMDGPWI